MPPRDLYTKKIHELSNDAQNNADKNLLHEYIHELREATESLKNQGPVIWERFMRNFYKKIINDAFGDYEIKPPRGMELYFAGSLGKAQATPFSDLDTFVMYENAGEKQRCKQVFEGVNNLLTRIHHETNQLFPDPAGINPVHYAGTVGEIVDMLDPGVDEHKIASLLAAKPITSNYKLGVELKETIKENDVFKYVSSPEYFYETAASFKSPDANDDTANVKKNLLRPVDFVLMALREEFSSEMPQEEDGSLLTAEKTIKYLRENQKIPEETIRAIETVFYAAMHIRYDLHYKAQHEMDELPKEKIADLIELSDQIKDFARERLGLLSESVLHDQIEDFKSKHKVSLFSASEKKAAFYEDLLANNKGSLLSQKIILLALLNTEGASSLKDHLVKSGGYKSIQAMSKTLDREVKEEFSSIAKKDPDVKKMLLEKRDDIIKQINSCDAKNPKKHIESITEQLDALPATPTNKQQNVPEKLIDALSKSIVDFGTQIQTAHEVAEQRTLEADNVVKGPT